MSLMPGAGESLAAIPIASPRAPPAAAAHPPGAPSSAPPDKERARAMLIQATDAILGDEWAKAEAFLRAAWQLEKTYDIAANLGDVELRNGRPRDAAEHLRFALNALPPTQAESRGRVQSRFDEARKLIAALTIKISPPGAEVSIDGEPIKASLLTDEVFVNPGDRVVKAKLRGYESASVSVAAKVGGSHAVTISLRRSVEPRWWPAALGGGASVVAAAFGVGFRVNGDLAQREGSDIKQKILADPSGKGCGDQYNHHEYCDDFQRAEHSRVLNTNTSTALFVASGVLAAGAVGYFIYEQQRITVTPAIGGLVGSVVW